MVVIAHSVEMIGRVIGWTVVGLGGVRQEVSTLAEWEKAYRGGGIFFTRIQGPNGIEEQLGASPKETPLGTKMVTFICPECKKGTWFPDPFFAQEGCCNHCGGF